MALLVPLRVAMLEAAALMKRSQKEKRQVVMMTVKSRSQRSLLIRQKIKISKRQDPVQLK
tara:strand:+ start:415 stop:594 length:180 start_codon:yes stop_codon:yes gene_type:complete